MKIVITNVAELNKWICTYASKKESFKCEEPQSFVLAIVYMLYFRIHPLRTATSLKVRHGTTPIHLVHARSVSTVKNRVSTSA